MWTALDEAKIDNGAMWMVSGSHEADLCTHRSASPGSHILTTDEIIEDTPGATCIELEPGKASLCLSTVVVTGSQLCGSCVG